MEKGSKEGKIEYLYVIGKVANIFNEFGTTLLTLYYANFGDRYFFPQREKAITLEAKLLSVKRHEGIKLTLEATSHGLCQWASTLILWHSYQRELDLWPCSLN